MAIFKCKMCGGNLEVAENSTVCECEYCGSMQTLPKLDNDKINNLYDRANHFRRNNEFDKAMGIYEQILNEDNTDAESYWSLVLCRYGIEYVEDPGTHKRIATVNRAQFTSIFDDSNYKSALQYADTYQKSIYEEEAKAINEIQKGILTISQKEEPFDVFICYKESDNNGRRTPDSVLANDLYHQLTQEGFKVFFSRITLEDKLGSAYEPYIFAALNSVKVMVVLGTKPEYFNAVWVKNEWSRYLAMIKAGEKKMLIPAYKDMDPYDLPDEFSHLQAQDMSKLGFMQDLIRGIKKITGKEEVRTVSREVVMPEGNGSVNVAPLLERAFMFLEDGDWESADEYCEKVLDQDPKNGTAYLGKLMAEMKVHKQGQLSECEQSFEDNSNYQKVTRFSDSKLKAELEGYVKHINERNKMAHMEEIYCKAMDMTNSAKTEKAYKDAAKLFEEILEYKSAASMYEQSLERAEVCRKDAIYDSAKVLMEENQVEKCETAIQKFETILGWKDSEDQILLCRHKIDELRQKEAYEKLQREKQAEAERIAAEKRAKRNKKIVMIATLIVCATVVFVLLLNNVIIPNNKYNDAIDILNDGEYLKAYEALIALNGYKDSAEKADEIYTKYQNIILPSLKYDEAIGLINGGRYVEAYETLVSLDGYKDSAKKADEIFSEYQKEKIKTAKVGEYIFFGKYEQDNNIENGQENIEWLVLEKNKNSILVISKMGLEAKKDSEIRGWLTREFFDVAFSEQEKEMIFHEVFLLSAMQVREYFKSDEKRACLVTEYAKAQGLGDYKKFKWWLQSNSIVDVDGDIHLTAESYYKYKLAVRPAMWIDLDA